MGRYTHELVAPVTPPAGVGAGLPNAGSPCRRVPRTGAEFCFTTQHPLGAGGGVGGGLTTPPPLGPTHPPTPP